MILTSEFQTQLADLAGKPWFYGVLAAVIVILIMLFIRSRRKANLESQISDFEIKLNSLRSVPLPFKVTKALALARVNKDIDEAFRECQDSFEEVQTNIKKLQEMLGDSDEFMQLRKYRMAYDNNNEISKLLNKTTVTVNQLDAKLNTILEKEDIQRSKITELKDVYHGIKMNINDNPDKYLFCWEALDKRISNIDHLFSEFESIMLSNDFDKATEKTNEIRAAINKLNETVVSIPELIAVSKGEIPSMVEEVQNSYAMVKKQGAYLDHLEVGKNLSFINDSLQEDLRRIKLCEIDGVNDHLLDCEKRLNQIKGQIEKEQKSYEELLKVKETTSDNMKALVERIENINSNYEELTSRYGLQTHADGLKEVSEKAASLNEQCHILMNNIQENRNPASTTLLNLSQLNTEITVCMNNVNKLTETVTTATEDEKEAREQLTKLSIVLNAVQSKIRNNRIPSISNDYNDDIVKSQEYLDKLEALLAENPINVTLVNSMKTTAVDLIYGLYEKVNRILGTAIMAENAIVIGNMYRSTYPDIDSELTRSELAYRNGEYTQALTIAMNTLKKVHPETVSDLLEGNKR